MHFNNQDVRTGCVHCLLHPPPPAGTQFLWHMLSPVLRQHTLNHSQMEPDGTTMFTPGMSVMFIRSIGHVFWGRSLHIQSMVMHIATSLMSVLVLSC